MGQQAAAAGSASGTLGELSQSDLSSLVPPMAEGPMNDSEDIFKHLADTTAIEIESILSEFSQTPYIKVSKQPRYGEYFLYSNGLTFKRVPSC